MIDMAMTPGGIKTKLNAWSVWSQNSREIVTFLREPTPVQQESDPETIRWRSIVWNDKEWTDSFDRISPNLTLAFKLNGSVQASR